MRNGKIVLPQGRATMMKQKGLSLIEMIIVIILVGILATIVFRLFNQGVISGAKQLAYKSIADNITRSYSLIVMDTGVPDSSSSNPLLANTSNTMLDVIVNGDNPTGMVATSYSSAYSQSGVKPLNGQVSVNTAPTLGTPGVYSYNGHTITLSVTSAGVADVTFAGVPVSDIQAIYLKMNPGATFNSGTAQTTGPIQWTTATNGVADLTIEKQI